MLPVCGLTHPDTGAERIIFPGRITVTLFSSLMLWSPLSLRFCPNTDEYLHQIEQNHNYPLGLLNTSGYYPPMCFAILFDRGGLYD